MVTADSVKVKLQGLIAKANEATGNTDADLTAAINALIAGFGQGGETSDNELQWIAAITGGEVTKIPDSVTWIRGYAFYNCENLALTKLPDGITGIGLCAFQGCTKLALESLPNELKYIYNQAFQGCKSLNIKTIPDTVTSINYNAFQGCSNLTEITFMGKPSTIAAVFNNCTNLTTINVPWAEGEVSGAPWGATNATINYNHTGG